MEKSLRRLLALPAETRVLPGHGPGTVIGDEQGQIERTGS
jgi:glyoxylase-like metal-dependent hydrolase (beta-lactamase superfamily II)